jgi:hypothetical protein
MNRDLPKRTRIVILAARIVVCVVLAFSFVISSLSLAGASTTDNAMSCCTGKAAGHCSTGLQAKVRVQPKPPEPMCGLKSEVTEVIVAEDPAASHKAANSDLITARLTHPCRQDCCATTSALSRKPTRREAAKLAEPSLLLPVSTQLLVESSFSSGAAAESVLNQSPPRGPPTYLSRITP